MGNLRSLRRSLLGATAALFVLISATTFADVINARYAAAAEVPVTADSFTATGKSVDLALNFAPAKGADLMLVHNTGPGFIAGTFDNLEQGQIVTLRYQGVAYRFVANYYGGNGRDLVLMAISLDDLSATAIAKLDDALLLALKKSRGEAPFDRPTSFSPEDYERGGRVLVDMKASVSTELLNEMAGLGGQVFNNWQTATTLRELRNANGTFVMQNDDWMTAQKAKLQATGLQPTNDKEAAVVATSRLINTPRWCEASRRPLAREWCRFFSCNDKFVGLGVVEVFALN